MLVLQLAIFLREDSRATLLQGAHNLCLGSLRSTSPRSSRCWSHINIYQAYQHSFSALGAREGWLHYKQFSHGQHTPDIPHHRNGHHVSQTGSQGLFLGYRFWSGSGPTSATGRVRPVVCQTKYVAIPRCRDDANL